MNKNTLYELMKEYQARIPGMSEPVKARVWHIVEDVEGEQVIRYTYSFSHHFYPGPNSDPSPEYLVRQGKDQAEIIARQYLEAFSIEYGDAVVNNHFY